jgi:hypothetical protein
VRRLVVLTLLAAAEATAAACTGGSETRTTTTTVVIELDSVPPITALGPAGSADVATAEAAVLTAADVPEGWELRPTVDPRARIDPSDCADNAVTLAAAQGDDLVLPDGTIVGQSFAAGDDVVVGDAFARLDRVCIAQVTRRVVETLIAALPGTPRGVTIGEPEVTLLRPSVPPVAADVHAYDVEFPIRVDSVDGFVFVHVIAVHAPGVLAVLTARRPATPLPAAEVGALAELAAQRLT